jgi:hypothetical protein
VGRVLAFGTVIVSALVVADLWAHYRTTSQVLKTVRSESSLIAGK